MVGVVQGMVIDLGKARETEDSEEMCGEGLLVDLEGHLTLLCATSMGSMAISHEAVPIRYLSLRVEVVAPLKDVHLYPSSEAQEIVAKRWSASLFWGNECPVRC